MNKKYTVTSALPYANGPLHIGHVAGAYLPADIFVRYCRSKGKDVLFICGSDEHGAAITIRAKQDNVSPKEIVDKYHEINKKSFADFGIDFDIYDRTSSEVHHKTASEHFKNLHSKNIFVKKKSKQFFDEQYSQFLADRYITGECPKCSYLEAYGDQCEKCGADLSPEDLKNPKSKLSGKSPVLKETTHWYLPMQNHEVWLKEWIETGFLNGEKMHDPLSWRSQVLGQCKSWISSGLKERAMTRDLNWGVKVPLPDAEGKVLYVWLDAPIGYISSTKTWAKKNNKNWEDYWKNENVELLHFIGKDNIVFHCIIFPIILKSHSSYVLPKNIIANEFLNLEGDKISTSRNRAIWLHEYLKDFPNQQDVLRYVLCSIAPETKDSDFTWKDFQTRNNSELVGIFGNFVNRVVVLTNKYWNGKVPNQNTLSDDDIRMLKVLHETPKKISSFIEKFKFRDALFELISLARFGNRYLAETEPWKLKKIDEKRTETILNISLQIVASLSILSKPFLPFTSQKLLRMLNIKESSWDLASQPLLKFNHQINKAELLFRMIEDEEISVQTNKIKFK